MIYAHYLLFSRTKLHWLCLFHTLHFFLSPFLYFSFCSLLSPSFFACLLFAIVGVWNISHTSMPAAVTRSVASSPNEGHAAIYVTPLYSLAPTHTLTHTHHTYTNTHKYIGKQINTQRQRSKPNCCYCYAVRDLPAPPRSLSLSLSPSTTLWLYLYVCTCT